MPFPTESSEPRRPPSPGAPPLNSEHPLEEHGCRAASDGDEEPLVDADEHCQQQEPRADEDGEEDAEEGHRPGEREQQTLERPRPRAHDRAPETRAPSPAIWRSRLPQIC